MSEIEKNFKEFQNKKVRIFLKNNFRFECIVDSIRDFGESQFLQVIEKNGQYKLINFESIESVEVLQ